MTNYGTLNEHGHVTHHIPKAKRTGFNFVYKNVESWHIVSKLHWLFQELFIQNQACLYLFKSILNAQSKYGKEYFIDFKK